MAHWAKAADFTELKPLFPTAPPAIAPRTLAPPAGAEDFATVARLKSGASWYYWIAVLSLVNSVVAFSGSDWRFLIGLGITQIFDAVGAEMGGSGKLVVLVLDLLVAGAFITFGVFANKRHLWAFITGMVLFALDGGIFLLAQDWVGVGFHAFALFYLFRGMSACRELKAA